MIEIRQTEDYADWFASLTARLTPGLMCASAVCRWAMLVMCGRWAEVSQNCGLIMDLAIGSTSFSEGQHW